MDTARAPVSASQSFWRGADIAATSDGSSSSIMAPSIANETCDPFTPVQSSCRLGNMVSYSVNASTPSDFSQTIAFAKAKNIRLVIRNTGHEYVATSL